MSLCYFPPVSHYKGNAVLNMVFGFIYNVFKYILFKQHKQQMIKGLFTWR